MSTQSNGYPIYYGSEENAMRNIERMGYSGSTLARAQEIKPTVQNERQYGVTQSILRGHQQRHEKMGVIDNNVVSMLSAWNAKIMENNGNIYKDEGYKMMLAENPFDTYITGSRNPDQPAPLIMAAKNPPLTIAEVYKHKTSKLHYQKHGDLSMLLEK